MKVYARMKKINDKNAGKIPFNINIANAIQGFYEMGFEIHFYESVKEIYNIYEKGDIVLDGIYQIDYCLNKFGIVYKDIDYPEILKPYLGRKIWTDKINHINNNPNLWPVFIKSEKKKITGTLIREPKDLIGCGSYYENYDVICSEPVEFIYECRGFYYYDKLISLKPYKGSWTEMNKLNTKLIEKAISDFNTWKDRPNACSLDWGVTKDGKTLFIEMNSAYALGSYGLNPIDYAKIISAFYSQIYEMPDECKF